MESVPWGERVSIYRFGGNSGQGGLTFNICYAILQKAAPTLPRRLMRSLPKEYEPILHRQAVGYRLRVLAMLVSRSMAARLGQYEITRNHWVVLSCLWQEDGQPVSQLSQMLVQVGGTVSEVLDRMEERKLVKRRRDRNDKRVWRVFLTERGDRLFDVLPGLSRDMMEQLFRGFSEVEKSDFSRFVDACIVNLKADYRPPCCRGKRDVAPEVKHVLPPYSIGYRLKLIYMLLSRRFNELAEPYEITAPQWHILRCLWNEDGLSCSDVSDLVAQVGGNLTAVLTRLEGRGLVSKRRDQNDRRCSRIWLEAGAHELFEPLMQLALTIQAEVFQGLTPADVGYFSQLVERAIANVGDPPPDPEG